MELVTHALAGVVTSTALMEPTWGSGAVWVFTVATTIPDIESPLAVFGMDVYLKHHRGLSHSVLFAPVIALALAVGFSFIYPEISFAAHFLIALSGVLLHLLLDWVNSYGTQLLYPLSSRHFALDLDVIFDLWVLLPLAVGVLLQHILPQWTFAIALAALGFCAASLAVRALGRVHARRRVRGDVIGVIPRMASVVNPFAYRVIEATPGGVVVHDQSTPTGALSSTQIECIGREQLRSAAGPSKLARVFVDWARFPCAQVEENEEGRLIRAHDLRFDTGSAGKGGVLEVQLDPDGQTIREEFSFRPRQVAALSADRRR